VSHDLKAYLWGLFTIVSADSSVHSTFLLSNMIHHSSFLGAFGNVKLACLKKDKAKRFALKAMKKNDIIQSKHVDHIENEKKILEMISHPFIVSATLATA